MNEQAKVITGFVDKMEGSYVVGWAQSSENGNCTITILDAESNLLAKGRASRHRPDLAVLNLGRTTLGFRVAVPLSEKTQRIHVLADGVELPSSPLLVGAGLFDCEAGVEAGCVSGWVSERQTKGEPPEITVLNQYGEEVARGPSHFAAKPEDTLFVPARFMLELDDDCFGAGELLLRIYANGVLIARTTCLLELRAALEIITPERVRGWLFSPSAPQREFSLSVYRDGKLARTGACDLVRTDVKDHFPDCGQPGFDMELPRCKRQVTESVSLTVRFANGARDLFEGPYLVVGRAAGVAALQTLAHLSYAGAEALDESTRAVLTEALKHYLDKLRSQDGVVLNKQRALMASPEPTHRLAIIMPIYRGVKITQACIESVLAHRNPDTDLLVLLNDHSPDDAMAPMLEAYRNTPNVLLLTNETNLGFVGTVNRGMALTKGLDVLLLNADTVLYAGGLDELHAVAYARPDIGTVTAFSNNATIFSYPCAEHRHRQLSDISWSALAALALKENQGRFVDVPTGHGFCMLIKREVIQRVGFLDEAFGRGYGEENDFCVRTAALGYRNVAAGGVIVEHKESISFGNDRASLIAQNQPRLNALYPDYTPLIMAFEEQDGLRQMRWALDRARLARAYEAGTRFALVTSNQNLEGGTPKAIAEIESEVGYGGATRLTLSITKDGLMELSCAAPLLCARFSATEAEALIELLTVADPKLVLAHQLLGFPAAFLEALGAWLEGRHSLYWAHDFYALCPRVTMIDAIGRFCEGADVQVCARCVEMGGAHENAALNDLLPAAHRALFGALLSRFSRVVTPSANAAGYLRKIYPQLKVTVLPHPEPALNIAAQVREGSDDEIVMLGAIGPHKGSHVLLDIARQARLTHPHLHFRIIGYTNIDKELKAIGNVTITGKYSPDALPDRLAETKGRLGLFLPLWPETYSYTLSELVKYGFIPLAPEIGAPADRIRQTGFGVVFPFPATPESVLTVIDDIKAGKIKPVQPGAHPRNFFSTKADLKRLSDAILVLEQEASTQKAPSAAAGEKPKAGLAGKKQPLRV